MSDETNNIREVLDAGIELAAPYELEDEDSTYSVIVPDGARQLSVRALPRNPALDLQPKRASGEYFPATVDAFIALVERHRNELTTTIWVHPVSGLIWAVFNDQHGEEPAWRDHRAILQLDHTPEWKHWTKLDGHLMSQEQFAEHLEDGIAEIETPPAADMLEIAQTFHAHTAAAITSARRLTDGRVQIRYEEEINATAGPGGQMEIPTEFMLAVAPFIGEDRYHVRARLRYRSNKEKLTIGYKLDRPDLVVRTVLEEIRDRLQKSFDQVFVGSPGN